MAILHDFSSNIKDILSDYRIFTKIYNPLKPGKFYNEICKIVDNMSMIDIFWYSPKYIDIFDVYIFVEIPVNRYKMGSYK